jgi:hypothetical protein
MTPPIRTDANTTKIGPTNRSPTSNPCLMYNNASYEVSDLGHFHDYCTLKFWRKSAELQTGRQRWRALEITQAHTLMVETRQQWTN